MVASSRLRARVARSGDEKRPARTRKALALTAFIETGHKTNNFDLLRLVGALCVLFDHSFGLLRLPAPFPPIQGMSYGFVGVLIFFSISGFLVSRSWAGAPRLPTFAAKRAIRLLPALVVSSLVTALVLGPLVTTLDARTYFADPMTKAFVLGNSIFQTTYGLPGVFADLPYPGAVNGVLWTLPLELKAYFVVAVIGLLGFITRRKLLMLPVLAILVLVTIDSLRSSIPYGNHFLAWMADIQMAPSLVYRAKLGEFTVAAVLFAAFGSAATLFALRRWVKLRWDLALVAFGIWLLTLTLDGGSALTSAALLAPYVLLVVAYRTHHLVHLPRRMGDYSYGAYLYAFPVQQTISHTLSPSSGWVMFALALPITMALAVASWHVVERPALRLRPAPTAPTA